MAQATTSTKPAAAEVRERPATAALLSAAFTVVQKRLELIAQPACTNEKIEQATVGLMEQRSFPRDHVPATSHCHLAVKIAGPHRLVRHVQAVDVGVRQRRN
jgi:hypothetical protein